MARLFLLRHAKSSRDDPTLADHERPLAPRGIRSARRMADHLLSEGIRPALVLCSSARRTRDTLELLEPALGDRADVRVENELYGADASELLARLRQVDTGVDSVMLVGHNPGLQDLAIELTRDGVPGAVEQLHTKFPTAALATLEVEDWTDLGPQRASLTDLVLPRQLE